MISIKDYPITNIDNVSYILIYVYESLFGGKGSRVTSIKNNLGNYDRILILQTNDVFLEWK